MSLEERKARLEIKKLEGETSWFKKVLDSIAPISSFITTLIAIGTLLYAVQSDLIKNLVTKLEGENSILKVEIIKLKLDTLKLSDQKRKIAFQVDLSKVEFKKLKLMFDKEKFQLINDIRKKQLSLENLNNQLSNTQKCYGNAQNFIFEFCVYDNLPETRSLSKPLKLRFNKTEEEIINMDISKMDYIDFLVFVAGYTKINKGGEAFQYIISPDKMIEIYISALYRPGGYYEGIKRKRYIRQFECWKNLPIYQKRELLKEVVIR